MVLTDTGVSTIDPSLPPNDGVYRTPQQIHTEYHDDAQGLHVILQDVAHRRFANVQREVVGDDEQETFDSTLTAFVSVSTGGGGGEDRMTESITLNGSVTTIVREKGDRTTGTFDAEIVSMSLSGNIPGFGTIEIRENPDRKLTGRTQISDLGDGRYNVDSFFDVFTELSVDGGQTWIAADVLRR